MFASTLSDATICLRCQARLARLSTPRPNVLARNQRPTSGRQRRRNTTISEVVQEHAIGDGPNQRILYPHGRLRGVPGRRVRENMASLGVETLGTPAEVILLRDAELGIKQARETVSEEVGEASMSAADLLAAMKAERGLPAPEDVARNIEKFRPLSPNIGLSQAEWLEIKKKLSVAFTTRQFAQYIIYKIQENATVEAQNRKASKILQKSTWTPGETPFEGFRLDNMERRRTVTKSPMSRKEILAERILGDCWGLHVRAGVNDTGELEVLIRPQHLSLLVHKDHTILKKLAEKYNAKIDVSRRKSLLRFTADSVTCFRLTKDLEAVLGNIRHMEFDLSPLRALLRKKPKRRQALDQKLISFIAEVTATHIEQSDNGQKLLIYYIGPSTNLADDSRRLLLSLIGRLNVMPSVLHHYSTSRPVTAALCPVNPIEGLSWVDQQQHWSRWQCATPKKPVNSGENTEKSKINSKKDTKTKELRQQVSNFLRRGIVDVTNATAETDQSMWLEHTEHRLDAVVGHILHSADEGSLIRTSGAIESSSVERTFATSAPGLLPLLNVLRPISNEPKQAIHLRMTPSPWTPYGLNGVAAFPQIEMQILFHPLSQMPFLHKLEAIIDERVSDIMLPQDVADLRFINRTSLRYAAIESDQNLAAFLANANLKVTGTGRLGAPPTLKMRIPRKALREDSTLAKETPPEDGSQDVEMEYLFAGLDFRDYIEYNLHDYALTYTRIEGGITGGRRGELSLHRTGMEVDRTNSNDEDPAFYEEFSRFFEAAFSLVQALDNKGTIQKVREVLYRLRRTKPQTKDEPAESGGEAGPVADSGSGGNGRRYEGWSEGLRPQE